MYHYVMGVLHTFPHRLIGHIDCVTAAFHYLWSVNSKGCALLFLRFHLTGSTVCKRHITVIHTIMVWNLESRVGKILPFAILYIVGHCTRNDHSVHRHLRSVIINDRLMLLPIALAWCKDIGASAFEHRDEIRHNKSLGEHILVGTE